MTKPNKNFVKLAVDIKGNLYGFQKKEVINYLKTNKIFNEKVSNFIMIIIDDVSKTILIKGKNSYDQIAFNYELKAIVS